MKYSAEYEIQCIMLHIAHSNNIATGYKVEYLHASMCESAIIMYWKFVQQRCIGPVVDCGRGPCWGGGGNISKGHFSTVQYATANAYTDSVS